MSPNGREGKGSCGRTCEISESFAVFDAILGKVECGTMMI